MSFLCQQLTVYRRSVTLSGRVIRAFGKIERGYGFLTNQIRRAALSVPANIAEATGRRSPRDRCRFLITARGSIHECIALIEVACETELISGTERDEMLDGFEEIAKMLSGLLRRWESELGTTREGTARSSP